MAVSRRPIRFGTDLARTSPTFAKVARCQRAATASRASSPVLRKSPVETQVAAQATVARLEKTLSALNESDVTPCEVLEASLKRARSQAAGLPVEDRPSNFSAQRRCEQAESDLQKAIDKRDLLKSELDEGRHRVVLLQAEVATPSPPPNQRSELEAEVHKFREELSRCPLHSDPDRFRGCTFRALEPLHPSEGSAWLGWDLRQVEIGARLESNLLAMSRACVWTNPSTMAEHIQQVAIAREGPPHNDELFHLLKERDTR